MRISAASAGRMLGLLLVAACAVAAGSAAAAAADWPKFMGPAGDGTSAEKGLMKAWPDGGPKVLWTVPLGRGFGAPAVRDGKVYILDRVDQKQDIMRCLDLATGKEDWTFPYDAPGKADHEGSRSVPAVSEKYVYTIGEFGHFHCIDLKTHEVVWKKNLLTDYGTGEPRWKVAQSPLLYKDMVIVVPQSSSIGFAAFDQATGKERWHSGPIGEMAYGSAKLITLDGVDQFVVVNGDGATSVAAADGKKLWSYAHKCQIAIPNVSDLGGGKFFITGGYKAGSAVFQVTHEGDAWTVKELGKVDVPGGHVHPALVVNGYAYVLCNNNEGSQGLVCFDSSCKVVWQTKSNPSFDKGGSILTGDGVFYIMDGEKGELYIVDPSPEGFKPLGKVKVLTGENKEIWGPLTLVDGKLLVRDQHEMKCLDVRGK